MSDAETTAEAVWETLKEDAERDGGRQEERAALRAFLSLPYAHTFVTGAVMSALSAERKEDAAIPESCGDLTCLDCEDCEDRYSNTNEGPLRRQL